MTALVTKHLPLVAGAPGGIKKLRELVLELAVSGRLVAQDASDEPVDLLLARIDALKATRIKSGMAKRQKSTDQLPAQHTHRIPESWRFVQLGEVVEIVRGITFPASEKSKEPAPGRIACLRTANVQDQIDWDDLLYVDESFVSRHDQFLQPYDIVMSMANSRELVGKVALVGGEPLKRSTFGGFLGVIRPYLIEPRFVMALLRTPSARSALIDSASQTTNIANISLGKLRPLMVALPPLAEQHRIVAKVDELMALCDRLEADQVDAEAAHAQLLQTLLDSLTQATDAADFRASWQRLSEHFHTLFTTEASIDALKQTVSHLAVMGKLVRQEATDERASLFLQRVDEARSGQRAVRSTGVRRRQPESGEMAEVPFDAPTGWVWCSLGSILEITGGVTLGRKLGDRKLISMPYLRVANVQRSYLVLDQIKEVEVPEDELDKYKLLPGDLLVTEGGDWDKVGRTAIWRAELPVCLHQNHVFRARPLIEDFCSRWVELYLNAPPARSYFAGSAKQTTNLASINMTQLRACAFPVPPLAEQTRIVAKVDELMALCDQLKAQLAESRQQHAQLATVLVEQAVAV